MRRRLGASSCYFRTTVSAPYRNALVQIDERCSLRCSHCFVSATKEGSYMPLTKVASQVVPRLFEARVCRVTLTGGEPTMHPNDDRTVAMTVIASERH